MPEPLFGRVNLQARRLVDLSEKALECSFCSSDLLELWCAVERYSLEEEAEAGLVKEGMEGEGKGRGDFV